MNKLNEAIANTEAEAIAAWNHREGEDHDTTESK